MPTVFRRPFNLPFLFYEHLKEHCEQGMTEESVVKAYRATFDCDPGELTPLIIERLVDEARKLQDIDRPIKKFEKRLYGTTFTAHLSNLDAQGLCFLLADHDPVKAEHLYCEVDSAVVTEVAKAKVKHLSELTGVWYEAVMFGMGGHYKDSGPNDNVTDMNEDPEAAKQRLAKLGLV